MNAKVVSPKDYSVITLAIKGFQSITIFIRFLKDAPVDQETPPGHQ